MESTSESWAFVKLTTGIDKPQEAQEVVRGDAEIFREREYASA